MSGSESPPAPPLWLVMLTAAMAGGMGWGIRGQYGHETGAMIAGVLVSLVLVFLFCPRNASIHVIRAAALGTIAMGSGGSMTYGQTIGLTHDGPLIGNWASLRWGMLGLAIKGGVWIGFAGFFLGLGLGGKRYRPLEMLLLVIGMLIAAVVGWALLNSPHDPANHRLPWLYFSDHRHWEPGVELKHRPEIWGGLWCALAGGIVYAALAKKDVLARNLALWGILGGALGFPLGQALQATNAWNPRFFSESFVEADEALIHEHHQQGTRQGLGDRKHHVLGVGGDRLAVSGAVSSMEEDDAASRHTHVEGLVRVVRPLLEHRVDLLDGAFLHSRGFPCAVS
jgi:hypothetical protein